MISLKSERIALYDRCMKSKSSYEPNALKWAQMNQIWTRVDSKSKRTQNILWTSTDLIYLSSKKFSFFTEAVSFLLRFPEKLSDKIQS